MNKFILRISELYHYMYYYLLSNIFFCDSVFIFLAEKFLMMVVNGVGYSQSKAMFLTFIFSFLMQGHSVQGNSKLAHF